MSVKYECTFSNLKFDQLVRVISRKDVIEELDQDKDPLALNETDLNNEPSSTTGRRYSRKQKVYPYMLKVYSCDKCDRQFKRKHSLNLHIFEDHSLKITPTLSCRKCDYKATSKSSLQHHTTENHSALKFACIQCKFWTTTKYFLERHIRRNHAGIKHVCNQCGNGFSHPGSLKVHVESQHLGIKKYSCNNCSQKFTRCHSLKLHIVNLHKENVNEFLNVAKSLEIKEKRKDVEFDLRKENESTAYDEQNDNDITHTENIKNENIEDDARPVITAKINSNMTSSIVSKSVQCLKCDKMFASSDSMMRHFKSAHEGIKHQCNHCYKHFTRVSSLNAHIKSLHEGIKSPCNLCGKQFRNKSNLNAHVKSSHLWWPKSLDI